MLMSLLIELSKLMRTAESLVRWLEYGFLNLRKSGFYWLLIFNEFVTAIWLMGSALDGVEKGHKNSQTTPNRLTCSLWFVKGDKS